MSVATLQKYQLKISLTGNQATTSEHKRYIMDKWNDINLLF